MESLIERISKITETLPSWSLWTIVTLLILAAGFLLARIAATLLEKGVNKWTASTRSSWDDRIARKGIFKALSLLIPGVLFLLVLPIYGDAADWVSRLVSAYFSLVLIRILTVLINTVASIYSTRKIAKKRSLTGVFQVLKIFSIALGLILVLSSFSGKDPLVLLSGLGAFSAILMLVFKDSIMGLASSLFLTANDMVAIGDWVSLPQFGADGSVTEININTVKVQNWDNTITTLPTYALMSQSFTNWKGMSESGGRRIKRAINVDMTSVGFASPELIQKLKKIEILKPFIEERQQQIDTYNEERKTDTSMPVNGRRMTNLGLFRAYLTAYLQEHPHVAHHMTCMVRQLAPGAQGVPLEIYCFSNDIRWVQYEGIQADLFDHILSAVPQFELKTFQEPTGADFRKM